MTPSEPTRIPSRSAEGRASPTRPVPPTATLTSSPSATVEATLFPTEAAVQVAVGEYYVDPQVVTITVGTTVEWVPFGDREHTIVSKEDGQPGWPKNGGVGAIGSPAFRATFREPGVYPYFCSVHPGVMDGVIVVIEENE
ncbi:MAG: plastocyanin/azurin family copper-binding protein [Anaerolineae bacterium]